MKSEDIATYGFDIILEPFLNDLKQLSMPDWYPINLKDGETIRIRASLVAHVADNPAAHQAIGLKESVVGALRKCRFCNADNNAMQNGFREDDFEAQTLKKHLEQCSVISGATQTLKDHYRTSYGINRKSIPTEFPHFDMFKQTPPGVMHVFLEGVLPLILQALIKHYVDTKVTNLATINSAIQSFPYSYMEITDKPNYMREKDLHGSTTLNQDAAKCHLLFCIFPFVVGDSINFSDSHWELYTLLSDITEICFASVVSLKTIAPLKENVAEYLRLFKELFPEQPFTLKQHYLVHFPKVILLLGPLINLWAMRFEAKHQYFKDLKKILNFKNICLSLSNHHQKKAAMNRSAASIFKGNEYGPVQHPKGEELSRIKDRISSTLALDPNSINNVESFKWIKLHGTKYIEDKCYLTIQFDDVDHPVFGQLSGIFELNISFVVFDVVCLETVGYDETLKAFEVRPQASGITSITPDMLITHTPLAMYTYHGSSYIKLKGRISDIQNNLIFSISVPAHYLHDFASMAVLN